VALTTLEGIPITYGLVLAHTEEREAVEVVLDYLHDCQVTGDKGLVGSFWQCFIHTRPAIVFGR
jgi:hypothetical protein